MRDWRRTRLFGPIVTMTLTGLALLVLLSFFLVERFDRVASDREVAMVQQGFARQIDELGDVISTQVEWDDAVGHLDRKFDSNWADFNLGNYLYTFNGFSRVFVVDGSSSAFYAAADGEGVDKTAFAPFAAAGAKLFPGLRQAELVRPPLAPRPGKNNIKVPSIQSSTVMRIGDQSYLVIATLVQPDFGKILPKGALAPIVIAAKPLDTAFLKSFAGRYMLDGMRLADRTPPQPDERHILLHASNGEPTVTLAWTPRQPGTMILNELRTEALIALLCLGLLGFGVVRRGSVIVNELIASESRAKRLAYHDNLTRLPNRAMLFDRMEPMLARAGEPDRALAVICVDLDRFKAVNDTLGHQAGDLLIEEVAQRLRRVCANSALIARQGGDEFVVLSQPATAESALAISEAILAALREPVETEFGRIEVACSIGVALIAQSGIQPSKALRWSDLALYRSKQLGRDRASLFEPEMDFALRERRLLEAELRSAMASGGLTMVYQPQADRDGKIAAVESLLRWYLPHGGEISPAQFVPLAEECGLMLPLGEFVLSQVFRETRDWQELRVAVNVSALQLRMPGFAAQVGRLAEQAGIDPARYEIELTETALIGDDAVSAANVDALKRLGFTIALDDFGTGYSSLSLLQRFAVDRIKIDRSFVSGLGASGETDSLVNAMVKLANAMGLSVIAEGVETQEQFLRLMQCGCREFQGHLFGKPASKVVTEALLGFGSVADRVRQRA